MEAVILAGSSCLGNRGFLLRGAEDDAAGRGGVDDQAESILKPAQLILCAIRIKNFICINNKITCIMYR